MSKELLIDGFVEPGFESIRELYENNMKTFLEANTQLCVYVDGEKVVDLWGSAIGDASYSPDSLATVFSSSKNFEAIALAWLLDRGLIEYDARITKYWAAFGGAGKEKTTLAELMRHEAGLANFNVEINPADLLPDRIKQNSVGAIIEPHSQKFREGEGKRREYHAITRGWIANEIFRRVDPAKRTIGEFIREELAGPLDADVILGVREEELSRIAPLSAPTLMRCFLESLKPSLLGRRLEWNFFSLCRALLDVYLASRDGTAGSNPVSVTGLSSTDWSQLPAFFGDPLILRGECPSGTVQASARGLAKVAAMMANRGQWQGQRVLSENAWQSMHAMPIRAEMGSFYATLCQGGVAQFHKTDAKNPRMERKFHSGREGYYGWLGVGGSIFQWHPELKIGFAYVPTSLFFLDFMNERGKAYQAEVVRCIEAAVM